jgi:hypothetical protein
MALPGRVFLLDVTACSNDWAILMMAGGSWLSSCRVVGDKSRGQGYYDGEVVS